MLDPLKRIKFVGYQNIAFSAFTKQVVVCILNIDFEHNTFRTQLFTQKLVKLICRLRYIGTIEKQGAEMTMFRLSLNCANQSSIEPRELKQ